MASILTEKKKLFAEEYLKCLNATEAAKRAGYSKQTAYSQGSRLLKDVEVQEYIRGLGDKVANDNILSIQETLRVISDITRGERMEEKEVVLKKPKFVRHPGTGKNILVYEEELIKTDVMPKNSDLLKGAELLGRYYSLFTDNNVHSFNGAPVFIVDDIGDVETMEKLEDEYANNPMFIDDY